MYELIRAGERSWYIDCPAKIGICLLDGFAGNERQDPHPHGCARD